MSRRFVIIYLILCYIPIILMLCLQHADGAEIEVVTVGVDPAFWDVAVQGGDAWNLAVDFAYVEGCGNGTLNVCWGPPAEQGPGWVSGYNVPGNVIWVWMPELFTAATACHEFGHALGLWYERHDGLSCMTQHLPQVATPDATDLMNLGVPLGPTHDGTGGPMYGN